MMNPMEERPVDPQPDNDPPTAATGGVAAFFARLGSRRVNPVAAGAILVFLLGCCFLNSGWSFSGKDTYYPKMQGFQLKADVQYTSRTPYQQFGPHFLTVWVSDNEGRELMRDDRYIYARGMRIGTTWRSRDEVEVVLRDFYDGKLRYRATYRRGADGRFKRVESR
jgi:hypothetical protein